MFELSGVNYEEVLEQGDSILVRVISSSSYRDYTVFAKLDIRMEVSDDNVCCKDGLVDSEEDLDLV